jgi:hypothetical protein
MVFGGIKVSDGNAEDGDDDDDGEKKKKKDGGGCGCPGSFKE